MLYHKLNDAGCGLQKAGCVAVPKKTTPDPHFLYASKTVLEGDGVLPTKRLVSPIPTIPACAK